MVFDKWGTGIGKIKSLEPNTQFEVFADFFFTIFKRKSGGVSEGVSEGVNILYTYIKKNPGKRIPHFEKVLKIPAKTLERWIKKLKEENRIKFKGSPKTGGYHIT